MTERPELAIIDAETFEKAQDIMRSRGRAFKVDKTRHSNQYLFSTIIKCKECGWSFRRVIRTYKNTYVRWVCSGHNGRGEDCCENKTVLDEEELIEILQNYFAALVKNKKQVTENIVAEFTRVYKVRDENVDYEKQLRAKLAKLEKLRTKYMDMYADDLISRQELNKKLSGTKDEKQRLENELKLTAYNITKGEQLKTILDRTFAAVESVADVHTMTNAQLREIVERIEVDRDGNVDIYLRLLGELGLDEHILIEQKPCNCKASGDFEACPKDDDRT